MDRRHFLIAGVLGLTVTAAQPWRLLARNAGVLPFGAFEPTPTSPADSPSAVAAPVEPAVPAIAEPALARQQAPAFSDVAAVGPDEGLRFLAGRHPRYPGANLDLLMGYSPAVILETMDTVVLDDVSYRRGAATLNAIYRLIAREVLEAALAVYGETPLVLALDAGHGGLRGVFFDPGSNGAEYAHCREVVAAIEDLATDPRYGSITLRRIFNDAIGDDFGLPAPNDRRGAAALTQRNIRGAMLAYEAAAWNAAHAGQPVALHVVSIHFNAGSGGTLALHQGDSVPAEYQQRSIAYARQYVASARPALNASGLLPYALGLPLGSGLSDDALLYEPQFRFTSPINPFTGVDRSRFPRRYAMLQTSLLQRDYADGALRYHGLR